MAALDISEELDEELELLERELGSNVTIQAEKHPVEAVLTAAPSPPCFVRAKLAATFPSGYPETPAQFVVAETSGISAGDCEKLRDAVEESSASASGSVHVVKTFRHVKTFLTERNVPPSCAMCEASFESDARGADTCVVLEPCLDAVHAGACWEKFYSKQIRERREKEGMLTREHGTLGAEMLALEGWPACPRCERQIDVSAARAAVASALR